jgi:dolichol-phosphate mannosyltransferase
MGEKNRFVRGLFSWVGFKSIGVELARHPRFAGRSNAHTSVVLDLALKGIFANSYKPLRLISLSGFLLSFISIVSIPILTAFWIVRGVPFGGFGTLVAFNLVAFSLVIGALGIIAEYLSLNYEEVRGRPSYVISEDSTQAQPRERRV